MAKVIFASTLDSDMRYAVKTKITSSFFYIESKGKKYALLDRIDLGIIPRKARVISIPLNPLSTESKKLQLKTNDRNKLAYYIFKKYGLFKGKIEVPIHFPLDMADFLRKHGAKLVPTYPIFAERAVKTKEEINYIRESIDGTRQAFKKVESILRQSKIKGNRIYFKNKILTSEFLKQVAEKTLFENGMFDVLGLIISSGKQTATPHHNGSGPIQPHQPIVCDIFPRHGKSGYFADMTRTYVKGKPSSEIAQMHRAVLRVQNEIFKKIRPGVSASELHRKAAEIFAKIGYGAENEGFVHGLGHGVGLDIHEKPSLKPGSLDILKAGNIITVEPGLYYPKIGGIRIEDVVLVTKNGYNNLTNYPKKLVIS
jgi:Xaa-Pro aminopeptidase